MLLTALYDSHLSIIPFNSNLISSDVQVHGLFSSSCVLAYMSDCCRQHPAACFYEPTLQGDTSVTAETDFSFPKEEYRALLKAFYAEINGPESFGAVA